MTNLDELLQPGLVVREGIRVAEDDLPSSEPWSDLASDNHIFTAISVADEVSEREKSHASIELLRREVEGGVVLDLGCGYGRLAKFLLAERVLDGYIGVDGSPVMLETFRRRYESNEAERRTPLLLVNGPIDRLRLVDESVQSVLIAGVLLHNPKDVVRRVIGEVHRVLAPGGKLIVVADFPKARSLASLQGNLYLAALRRRGDGQRNGPVRYYTEAEVRSLLADFATVRIRHNGFQLLPKAPIGLSPERARGYRRLVADPVQRLGARLLPTGAQERLYVDLTVVAEKATRGPAT
jgi:ubiquinone/menaquinone biosynthesis C-methylase UbiE